jgi:hypothetical protein
MNERIGPPNPLSRLALGTVERVGFWGSVLLPATYLPLLYGLDDQTKLPAIAVLATLNVACLLVGRRHLN